MLEFKHKVTVNLSLIDAKDLWQLIHGESSKYAASRVDSGTTMKYFQHGVQVIRASDFVRSYREQSDYQPLTPWVVLISLAGDLEPNGKQIVRRRNRTSLAISCTIESIVESSQIWGDPGLALDPTFIKYNSSHVDYRSGKVTIRAQVPQGMEMKETPFMYTSLFKKVFARFVAEFKQLNTISNVDHFASRDGEDILVDSVITFLTQIGYRRSTAKPARDRIAAWLIEGEDSHAYVVKGVAFPNELAFTALVAAWGSEERALRIQHDRPIVEQLMEEHPNDPLARLKQMDLHQLSLPPDMNAAVMDFQIGLNEEEWLTFNNEHKDALAQGDEEFVIKKWQDRVIQRWKALQGK